MESTTDIVERITTSAITAAMKSKKGWVTILAMLGVTILTAVIAIILTYKTRQYALLRHKQNVDEAKKHLQPLEDDVSKRKDEISKLDEGIASRQRRLDSLQIQIDTLDKLVKKSRPSWLP